MSHADEASSGASSTSSPYVSGAGPGFDAQAPPPNAQEPPPQVDGEALLEEWQEKQVSDWLKNAGDLAHAGFGVGELDWVMTKRDLERIAPPLTRILNRYQPTRAVAAYSDPAAVAIGFGMYGWRSTLERIAIKRAEVQAQAGAMGPAPPGAGAHVSASPPTPGPAPANGAGGPLWADQLRATRPPQED